MKSQKKLIYKTDWDNLIILDACRYDFFKEIYEKYIEGDLEKVKSEGTRTPQWLKNTFAGNKLDDVVYISANPYVNSANIDSAIGGINQ